MIAGTGVQGYGGTVMVRRIRVGVLASALVLGALLVAWRLWRDHRALLAARERVAVEAADLARLALARGEPLEASLAAFVRTRGYDVRIRCVAASVRRCVSPLSPALLDSLRRDEAPRSTPSGAIAPLKDADDWDVVGAVEITPRPGAERTPPPFRGFLLLALGTLAVATLWLWGWAGRTAERTARETLTAWSFLGLPLAHLVLFSFLPVGFTVYLAFHEWALVESSRTFVGLANFRQLARDGLFWTTLRNTALYTLYVPVTMAAAVGLALLLNRRRGGERVLRAVVFLPFVTSTVAIAIVWQWMFNPDFGLLNYVLSLAGIPSVDWLGSPRTALASIIVVTVWTQVGYQMVIFLAGLQGIPATYYDAALVDGATPWQRFWHVTLPLLKPVTLFVLVTGIISGFQVFTLVYMMTEGGPLHSTDVLVYRIYQTAWEFLRFGYASAMALVLFAVLLAATAVQFKLLGRRIEHV